MSSGRREEHSWLSPTGDTDAGLMVGQGGDRGVFTRVDAGSVYDISNIGDSLKLEVSWNYFGQFATHSTDVNHMFEIGIMDADGYFGETGVDSLFIAGLETDVMGTSWPNISSTLDLLLFDDAGVADPDLHDAIYTANPLATIAGDIGVSGWGGDSLAFGITYTNIGSDQLRVDVGARKYSFSTGTPYGDNLVDEGVLANFSHHGRFHGPRPDKPHAWDGATSHELGRRL